MVLFETIFSRLHVLLCFNVFRGGGLYVYVWGGGGVQTNSRNGMLFSLCRGVEGYA